MVNLAGPEERMLKVLHLVEQAGQLSPAWEPYTRRGFVYRATNSPLEDERLFDELEVLSERDYLERVFVERLSVCANCDSHSVNVHEACVSCASSNLAQFQVLFHFRCGYTGPITAFKEDRRGLRCPKCHKILADLGTQYDSPGNYMQCRSCAATFQTPDVGARCTSCGARYSGTSMAQLRTIDVPAYRLTNLGRAALRESRLLDEDEMRRADNMLERRHSMVALVDDARRKRQESGTKLALFALRPPVDDLSSMDAIATTFSKQGCTDVKLGRIDGSHVLALIENVAESKLRGIPKALASQGIPARPVDLADGDDVDDSIDVAARLLDAHA